MLKDFTSRIGDTTIEKLSHADESEVVRCVREVPLDYQPVNPFLFSIKPESRTLDLKTGNWFQEGLKKVSEGLASLLIGLQLNPIIRFQTQSQPCKALANEVGLIIKNEFKINKAWEDAAPLDNTSLLLIVDRRNDLITPILNNWSYYSMIHEFFSIKNNRINLADVPDRQEKDPRELLISVENDRYFEDNYYKNYGEVGATLKLAVENLKTAKKSQQQNVDTLEGMRRFIDEYPEAKRYATSVQNHVFLMSEMTRLVNEYKLIEVSECEQELVCGLASSSDTFKKLRELVSNPTIRPIDAVRLVSLYTVCKSDKSGLKDLKKHLRNRKDIVKEDTDFIDQLEKFNLSKPQNPFDETVQHVARMIVQGVKGVDNVLTQYKPPLAKIIDDLQKVNRLKETDFAFSGERYRDSPPKRIIIFCIGGTTYEEALIVDKCNRNSPTNTKIIIGGTNIHNFESFKDEVRQAIINLSRND